MKFIRLLIFSGLTFFSLFIGFRVGMTSGSNTEFGLASSDNDLRSKSLLASQGAGGQVNLLLITVDDSQLPEHLISAWLMGYHHTNPNMITFIPLYPGAGQGGEDKDALLVRQFQMDRRNQVATRFLESLANIYRVSWDGVIVISGREVAHAVDTLGGVMLAGENIDGSNLLAGLVAERADTQVARRYQADAIKAACNQIATQATSAQVDQFASSVSAKLSASLRDPEINSESLKDAFLNTRLRCDTPTVPDN